eukprot:GEMP01002755.1.p1 GENE.GEMP01002755.1~~GEMP01002755.1.p1  ORF type:complete len:775 (+),score=183.81 GEMP01002755.1:107-2431(+)
MGIKGLHKFLRPVTKVGTNITLYRGQKVGVDAMCWMHRGAVASAVELMMGQNTAKFINFFAKMISVLLFSEIEPIIVFDGANTPAKDEESAERRKAREKCRAEAMELHQRLGPAAHHAPDMYKKCVGGIQVTHEMTQRVMEMLNIMEVKFIVAPYEADAQLSYMCRIGEIACVITEDSDLLVYGCPRIFCKMTQDGLGELIEIEDVFGADVRNGDAEMTPSNEQKTNENQLHDNAIEKSHEGAVDGDAVEKKETNESLQLMRSWNEEMFVLMCILAGCDYLRKDKRINGLGLLTLVKKISNYRTTERFLRSLYAETRWTSKFPCHVDEYLIDVEKTFAAFQHHVVLQRRRMQDIRFSEVNGASLPESFDVETICGPIRKDRSIIRKITTGCANVKTLKPCSPAGLLTAQEIKDIWYESDLRNKQLREKENEAKYADMVDPNKLHFKYLGEAENPIDGNVAFQLAKRTTNSVAIITNDTPVVQHKACSIMDQIIREQKKEKQSSPSEDAQMGNNLATQQPSIIDLSGGSVPTESPVLRSPPPVLRILPTVATPNTQAARSGASATPQSAGKLNVNALPGSATPHGALGPKSLLSRSVSATGFASNSVTDGLLTATSPSVGSAQTAANTAADGDVEMTDAAAAICSSVVAKSKKKLLFLGGGKKKQKLVISAETEVDTRNVNCGAADGDSPRFTLPQAPPKPMSSQMKTAAELLREDEEIRRAKRRRTAECEADNRLENVISPEQRTTASIHSTSAHSSGGFKSSLGAFWRVGKNS